MGRLRLPNKRFGANIAIEADGVEGLCTINVRMSGVPAEIFLEIGQPGSTIDLIGRDAAVLLSLLLQYGVEASAIAASLARLDDGRPATIIGAAADLAARAARAESGAPIAEALMP